MFQLLAAADLYIPSMTFVWLRDLLLTSQLTSSAVWTSINDVAFLLALKMFISLNLQVCAL